MMITTTVKRLKPDTIMGYSVQITHTYTSFDKAEIDSIEEQMRQFDNVVWNKTNDGLFDRWDAGKTEGSDEECHQNINQ